ncbi:hypothetical protein LCGC14_2472390, partial [marine sediment metagenome]
AKLLDPDQSTPLNWKVRQAMGVLAEPYWLTVLSMAGWEIDLPNETFSCGPHMIAHPDAVLDTNFLVELKSISGWGYRKLIESVNGVFGVERGHFTQAQLYMYAADKEWCLYLSFPADAGLLQSIMRQKKKYGCVAPGEKILTADLRWTPIEQIKMGDKIIGFDNTIMGPPNSKRRFRITTVTYAQPLIKTCSRIIFSDGTEIIASDDHPWFTENRSIGYSRWRTTDQLNKKRETGIKRIIPTWDIPHTYEAGWLAGFFDGEGNLFQNSHGVTLTAIQKPGVVMNRALSYLKDLKVETRFYKHSDGTNKLMVRGGNSGPLKFLGRIRPARLLQNLKLSNLGAIRSAEPLLHVKKVTSVGKQTVIGLSTDSETYIVEGFGAHNSHYNLEPVYFEWIHRDENAIRVALDRAETIVQDIAGDTPPIREFKGFEYNINGSRAYPCGFCLHLGRCSESAGTYEESIHFAR